jgi:transposase-like protein
MASKKTSSKKTKKTARPAKALVTDKELLSIQKELQQTRDKSILIESDLRKLRDQLNACITAPQVKKKAEITLRHYKFVCGKCVHSFEHKAIMPVFEQRFLCPKCRKEHTLEIHPTAVKNYRIVVPDTVKIRK